MLPNMLVIGAQKSGTTTVWHALNRHPDIFMSPDRETGFFNNDNNFNRGAAHYEAAHFHGWNGETICGEKTPEYLATPQAAPRIRAVLGDAVKLIVLLRNPAERAHSGYRHYLMTGWEWLGFREALAAEPERIARYPAALTRFGYLARGRYAQQLPAYLELFPRENILILFFDDLVADQAKVFAQIYAFLGVATVRFPDPISEGRPTIGTIRYDAAAGTVEFLGKMIRSPSPGLVEAARAHEAAVAALRPLSRDDAVEINRTHFAEDIAALSKLTGRNLDAWLGR